MHYRMFSSIPALYSLAARGTLISYNIYISRLCQMSPGVQNHPWLWWKSILFLILLKILLGQLVYNWKVKSLGCVQLLAIPWTVDYQAPPPMGFSRQEYWSGLPFPSPGDLPNPGIEPRCPTLEADALTSEPPGKPRIQLDHSILPCFWEYSSRLSRYRSLDCNSHTT